MRTPIIAGNWKMNNTINEGLKLVEEIKSFKLNNNVEAVVCVPFICLSEIKKAIKDTDIKLGAQNKHYWRNLASIGTTFFPMHILGT